MTKTPPPYAAVERYLNELRYQGHINMFAAHPYIMTKFGFDHEESRDILNKWINSLRATGPIGPIEFDDNPIDIIPNFRQPTKREDGDAS
jgi:hypothetical protein